MGKSRRRTALLLLAAAAGPASAADVVALTPAQAKAVDRAMAPKPPRLSAVGACEETPGEVVVCGRRISGGRMTFEEEPGTRHHLLPGEPPSASAALSLGSCCSHHGGVDVLKAVGALRGLIGH